MKKWSHEVDARWLAARKDVLTATEVVSLIPEYKRMKKQPEGTISPGCAALWAAKHSDTELDTRSFSEAARGHVFEPYAVEEYCMQKNLSFYHWDDRIIYTNTEAVTPLAFSPDALNIKQLRNIKVVNTALETFGSLEALEIKCFGPEKHMKTYLLDKKEIPERMQLAVAMVVCENMEKGSLVFYCPMMQKIQMYERTYTRSEMEDEMALVKEIWAMYNDTALTLDELNAQEMRTYYTEDRIYEDMLEDHLSVMMF